MRFTGLAALAAVAAGCGGPRELDEADMAALHALDSAWVQAWLRDDTSAVLALLTGDAVLMPAGRPAVSGQEAIRRHWWPQDGSHTRILSYTVERPEIAGEGTLGFVRGTDALTFTYAKDSTEQTLSSRSVSLSVVRKDRDGHWRFARRMWAPAAGP